MGLSGKSRLGKGLEALISTSVDKREYIIELEPSKIIQNPTQPRKKFVLEKIKELANSIMEKGIIQPIIVREKEGRNILSKIKDNEYVIALDLKGKHLTSEEFAQFISEKAVMGRPDLTFIIGGSLGISQEVLARADYKLCFSKMTFPHQLFRVMLIEQIYRGFRIINGEPYHK